MFVPALKLGDRTCVSMAPPWAAHPLVDTEPVLFLHALENVWKPQDHCDPLLPCSQPLVKTPDG